MGSPYTITIYVEDDGNSPYEDFEKSLTGDCLVTAVNLRKMLAGAGIRLPKKVAKDVGGGVWELKGRCSGGGVRIYYWRSGRAGFTLACGEVKDEDDGDPKLIKYAKDCYQKTRPQRKTKPESKQPPARGRKRR